MAETGWEEVWLHDWDGWWGGIWDVGCAFDASAGRVLVLGLGEVRSDKPDIYFVADFPRCDFQPTVPGIDESFAMFVVVGEVFGVFRSCV